MSKRWLFLALVVSVSVAGKTRAEPIAIKAGVASIEHGRGMSRDLFELAAAKGIVLVPAVMSEPILRSMARPNAEERYRAGVIFLREARGSGVAMAFGADLAWVIPNRRRGRQAISLIEPMRMLACRTPMSCGS